MKVVLLITRLKIFYVVVAFTAIFFSPASMAQQKFLKNILSPLLDKKLKGIDPYKIIKVIITCQGKTIPAALSEACLNLRPLGVFNNNSYSEATLTLQSLQLKFASIPEIIFIEDGERMPYEELRVANLDLSLNSINTMHHQFPQWNGDGIIASIKENKPDTTDIDLKNRFLSTNLSSNIVSLHATVMATMMAGGGNSWHLGRGAAWGSTLSSSNFTTLLPDVNAHYQQYKVSVQNHSYGVGVENYYGADAAAYDASSLDNPTLLHIFSAGNAGMSAGNTGAYSGITGFANITGSFKMAKNILTVGATDSFNTVAPLSSKGPAYDGRVNPALVAFGEDGSSGAAALVSGVSLVLQQQYKQLNSAMPDNALIKAVLINSADDVGNKELDYSSGYGSLNGLKATKTIQNGYYFSGAVANSSNQIYTVNVPAGIKKIKVTLTWNDLPAMPNAVKSLVNDLDLVLVRSATGEVWQPWVLNSFPNIDSLQKPAERKRDSLNNTEQVTINNPVAGMYQFKITGFNISGLPQKFFIAYQLDSADIFEWQFPTANDFIFSGSINTIRWTSTFGTATGILEYTINNGQDWKLIDPSADLLKGYYQWQAPAEIKQCLLRMTNGNKQFVADTFNISQKMVTGVGFNCPDSFLIYWDKLPGINTYNIYTLDNKYLALTATTTNNYLLLKKNTHPSQYYAVAPVIERLEGLKSYTFNYSNQGVDCYFRTFFALLENNIVRLNLSLGTLYNINKIVVEKLDGQNFIPIQQITNINNTDIRFTDALLIKGVNSYRIKLELTGGGTIYSSIETVYNFTNADYIIYPNPVSQHQFLNILSNDALVKATLQVFNSAGQKAGEYSIKDVVTSIATGKLSKGLYYFRFIKAGAKDNVIKVIIY